MLEETLSLSLKAYVRKIIALCLILQESLSESSLSPEIKPWQVEIAVEIHKILEGRTSASRTFHPSFPCKY